MKRTLLALAFLLVFNFIGLAQTYYWVGGVGTATTPISWKGGWNTAPDSSGAARTISTNTDTLIFDGALLTTKSIFVGDLPKDSCAVLKFINGINVTLTTTNNSMVDALTTVGYSSVQAGCLLGVGAPGIAAKFKLGDYVASGATSTTTGGVGTAQVLGFNGTDSMYLSNEGSVTATTGLYRIPTLYIKGSPGLIVDASSILNVGASSATWMQPYAIVLSQGAKGEIFGKLNFQSRGANSRISSIDPLSLSFKNGSVLAITTNSGAPKGYLVGNPFISGSIGSGNLSFINDGGRVVFEAGSTLSFNAQQNSPLGAGIYASAPLKFVPAITFRTGSNYDFKLGNGYFPYFYHNGVSFANLFWNSTDFPKTGSSQTIMTFTPAKVDTIIFNSLGNPTTASPSVRIPVYGEFINNSSSTFIFPNIIVAGSGIHHITTGTNTTPVASVTVADSAQLVLTRNLTLSPALGGTSTSLYVLGKIDFGSYTVNGAGTGTFTSYNAATRVYNTPAGSGLAGGISTSYGSTTIQVRGVSSIPVGSSVSSTSHPNLFPPGTVVSSYSSGGNYILSQPALFTIDSTATVTPSLTFSNASASLALSNGNGIPGALNSFSALTLGSNTNYLFNAETITPFPASITSPFSVGDLIANANLTINPPTSNFKVTVNGTLSLNNALLSVPESDTLRIASSNSVAGTFGSSSHIKLSANSTTGAMSYVQVDNIRNVARVLPLGNGVSYMPVTLTASTNSAQSFVINVSTGATQNGLPNGVALLAADKTNLVDANYIINRISGTDAVRIKLGFPANLKGSGFTGIQNHQLGIQHFDGATWEAANGYGSNDQNYAQASFTSFSPFRVTVFTEALESLPVHLTDFTASKSADQVVLSWKVSDEVNMSKYLVERTTDGVRYSTVASINANGSHSYTTRDLLPFNGKNIYRLKAIDKDGSFSYSRFVTVDFSKGNVGIAISPNPVLNRSFTLSFSGLKGSTVLVRMYGVAGQLIMQQTVANNASVTSKVIDLPAGITKGMYQIVLTDGLQSQKASLIVQ